LSSSLPLTKLSTTTPGLDVDAAERAISNQIHSSALDTPSTQYQRPLSDLLSATDQDYQPPPLSSQITSTEPEPDNVMAELEELAERFNSQPDPELYGDYEIPPLIPGDVPLQSPFSTNNNDGFEERKDDPDQELQ